MSEIINEKPVKNFEKTLDNLIDKLNIFLASNNESKEDIRKRLKDKKRTCNEEELFRDVGGTDSHEEKPESKAGGTDSHEEKKQK
jgi:hypothetical protein